LATVVESAAPFLAAWSNFYLMIGSSAAALTGLMFVVITLVTRAEQMSRTEDGIASFSTPTVIHFSEALLVAAILSAPWRSLIAPAVLVGLTGLYGAVYIVRVFLRTRGLTTYTPDLEDWAWYTMLPFVAYGAILCGAIGLFARPASALLAIAGGMVLLVFIGIRNAWDVVAFLVIQGGPPPS
jgi:hypothetical protein